MTKYFFIFICITLLGCNSAEKQAERDEEIIVQYLKDNNIEAIRTSSGLYYWVENLGVGKFPTANSTVKVAYKGYFTNNSVFDESDAEGVTFGLNQVIQGWQEGMLFFKEGGNGKLFIPSALGYGKNPPTGIPKNAVLIFDVNLKQVL
jgi:FKBP-type peptidyl-prolyl cis-trans isomerase FkpA